MTDQFFVYFRHTPKGVKLLVSRELKPLGESKVLMRRDDPLYQQAQTLCNALIGFLRQQGFGGVDGRIPSSHHFSSICKTAGDMSLVKTTWLPKNGVYGDRILVQV